MNQKEWIAVAVSIFVVGFFFVFGPGLIALFTTHTKTMVANTQQLVSTDTVVGTGDEAIAGSKVTVDYVGHFVNGSVFDSSISRGQPFTFTLGGGQVIQGWDKGIAGMRVGGKRTLSIPPELGYGPNDYGPIPGNSTLIFDVELLKVEK